MCGLILLYGCTSVPEPKDGVNTLIIGKIIHTAKGYNNNQGVTLNGTNKSGIKLTISNDSTKEIFELRTGLDGLIFSTSMSPGKYSLRKIEIKVKSNDGWAESYMSLNNSFTVEQNAVSNLGFISWNCNKNNFDEYKILFNKEYESVIKNFKEKNMDSKWWDLKTINVSIGNYNSDVYTKPAEIKPDNFETYYELGRNNYERGEYDKAIENLDKSLELNPEYKWSFNQKGLCYNQMKEYDKAVECFTQAIKINPGIQCFYYNRSISYIEKKQYGPALFDLNKTIQLDPKFYQAYYNIGRVYLKKNDYEKALINLSRCLELKPDYTEAINLKSVCYNKLKKFNKSIEMLNKSLRIDPESSSTLYDYACFYSLQNKKSSALTYLENAIEKGYNDISYIKTDPDLDNIRNEKKYKTLLILLKSKNSESSKHVKELIKLGKKYYNLKEYTKALEYFAKALEAEPVCASAIYNCGLVYMDMEEYSQAIKNFSMTIEIDYKYSMAYHNRAVCYFINKDMDKALADYEKAAENDPFNYWSYYNMACIYSLKKNIPLTLLNLEKAIEKDFNDIEFMEKDKNLDYVKSDEKYKNLIVKLKEKNSKTHFKPSQIKI